MSTTGSPVARRPQLVDVRSARLPRLPSRSRAARGSCRGRQLAHIIPPCPCPRSLFVGSGVVTFMLSEGGGGRAGRLGASLAAPQSQDPVFATFVLAGGCRLEPAYPLLISSSIQAPLCVCETSRINPCPPESEAFSSRCTRLLRNTLTSSVVHSSAAPGNARRIFQSF